MSYTAYTAFIITLHHLSALVALVLAIIASALAYGIFIKRHTHKLFITLMVFLVASVVSSYVAGELLHKKPVSFEMVQTN